MSKYYNIINPTGNRGSDKRHKNPWKTALKICCWTLGCLIVLVGIAVWMISYYFSPQKITSLIEDKCGEYLQAEVKIGKLDYKLFRTYPWFVFEIDSLTIISKSLDDINDEIRKQLPLNSDSLAMLSKIKGEVNVHGLFHNELILKGIEIDKPEVNIVMVNDSISNFNIVTHSPGKIKMPQIDISEIKVEAPILLSFFSLQDSVSTSVASDLFYLTRNEDKVYNIGFEGLVNAKYKEYVLPDRIPVRLDASLSYDIPSISLKLYELYLSLAGLAFEAKGDFKVNPKGIKIGQADFNVRIDNIFELISTLPTQLSEKVTIPDGLSGNLPLGISISLLEPFSIEKDSINNLSLESLPPMRSVLKIEDANLAYAPPKEKKITADDVYLEALAEFNPAVPTDNFIDIKELRLHGEGITLDGSAGINNLLDEEQTFRGDFFFHSTLMKTLSYLLPQSDIKLNGILKGEIVFTGNALNLGKEGFTNLELSGKLSSNSLKINSTSVGNITFKNIKSDYKAGIPAYPLNNNYAGTKLAFDFDTDSLIAKASGYNIFISALKMQLEAKDTISGNPDPFGDFRLIAGGLKVSDGNTSLNSRDIKLNVKGSLNSAGSQPSNSYAVPPAPTGDDALIQSRVAHTPLQLEYNGGGIMQTAMNIMNLTGSLDIKKGEFISPAYLYPVDIRDLSLSSNLNKINFSANRISLANSSFSIRGEFDGLKPFMTTYSATPLVASADIDFTNVDINRLAWGYYGALIKQGIPSDSAFFVPEMTPFSAADSLCIAIPRNITTNIRLKSKAAEYMQYKFSPLSTDIIVRNGVATLSKLTVGTPYCTAIVDWTYSTEHLDNIFMNLDARVKDFSFEPFYGVFPQMIEKAKEIKNFTGVINANIGCHFQMFPDMFMNEESLRANFNIKGTDLQFARQGRIEKITHLMLIEGDTPIKLRNLDITGSFHDNLLQLNPFKIAFDDYQLEIAGVNNTSGDMYYHLALEKSPFHLPFGVSLSGKFKHPEVKLGGTHINDYKTEMISINPGSNLNINIMAYLRHGWLLFVQEAAKYGENEE